MGHRPPHLWLAVCVLTVVPSAARAQQLVYTAVNPCRIVDTRFAVGGVLTPGVARPFNVVGSTADFPAQGGTAGGCGIPGFTGPTPQVTAVVFNFVAVNPQGAGNLRAWASDQMMPNASVLNYAQVPGLNIANGLVVPVRQDSAGNDLTVLADASSTHLVLDVVGYFKPMAVNVIDLPVVPIAKGGTGSTTQNFVDLSTAQTVAGNKTFSNNLQASGNLQVNGTLTTGTPALAPVVGSDPNLRLVRGIVSGTGSCTIQLGDDFTCVRNSTGNYTITFTPPFAGNPVPVVMPVLTTLVQSLTVTGTTLNMQTVNTSNVAADSVFAFLLVGPR